MKSTGCIHSRRVAGVSGRARAARSGASLLGSRRRKRTEELLRRTQETLGLVMRGGRMGAWWRDLATNAVWWSPELEELFGLPPGGFEGTEGGFYTFVHPDDRERLAHDIAEAIEGGRDYVVEFRFRHASGEWRWMEGRGRATYGEDGRPDMLFGIGIDITDRKRDLASLKDRAEFEKYLIGIVSHDLKNPLAVILLQTGVALRRVHEDERGRKAVARIRSAAERALRMVADLLDFTQARLGGGIPVQRERVNLCTLIDFVVEEVRTAHPGRAIRVQNAAPLTAECDADRIAQAFGNVLTNAVLYSPPALEVGVRSRQEGDTAVIEIENGGDPIRPELLPTLFQPLQRATTRVDKAVRSVGLGLYIVDQIVTAHGGRVDVRSTSEEGTTFTIRLPRAGAPRPSS